MSHKQCQILLWCSIKHKMASTGVVQQIALLSTYFPQLIAPFFRNQKLSGPADDDDAPLYLPPDIDTFTTWTPSSWSRVNFDEIKFPADSAINIRTVRSYMAVAMILWYDTALLAKYDGVWEALKYAIDLLFSITMGVSSISDLLIHNAKSLFLSLSRRCRHEVATRLVGAGRENTILAQPPEFFQRFNRAGRAKAGGR